MRYLVTILAPGGDVISHLNESGRIHQVDMPTPFLVSAGQTIGFGIAVEEVLPWLIPDLPRVEGVVQVTPTYDMSYIPSNRSLSEILQDVVNHGLDEPRHGSDCICMDQYVRELRLHVSKAMPPDTNYEEMSDNDRSARLAARARITGVLHRLWRNL